VFKLNPLLCKTEGMRRLSIVLLAIGLLGWVVFWFIEVSQYRRISDQDWLALIVVPVLVYIGILLIKYTIQWVMAGFKKT